MSAIVKKKINNVEVEIQTIQFKKNKQSIEVYTEHNNTKMFIEESLITNKNLKISVWIDGENFNLSPEYDYQMSLNIFTKLVNLFKKSLVYKQVDRINEYIKMIDKLKSRSGYFSLGKDDKLISVEELIKSLDVIKKKGIVKEEQRITLTKLESLYNDFYKKSKK
jgi:hypothetical protein